MSGTFYGLEIAKTGLFGARTGLNLTGHNISNANTVGYTRQRVTFEAIAPAYAGTRFGYVTDEVGGGISTGDIQQIRDAYLDVQIRSENADMGYWSVVSDEMEFVETVMDETSDSSITQSLSDFYSALNSLSNDADSSEMRTYLQQQGILLCDNIQHTYEQLMEIQDVMNESMNITAIEINSKLESIAQYNEKIYSYELGGEVANDLRDQRNVLLDELSELVNIEHYENTDGQLIVEIEGVEFVNHTTAYEIDIQQDTTGVTSGTTGYYSLYYGAGMPAAGTALAYSSGELEAYRFMRDENTSDNIGIPKILDDLNILATAIADEFNAVHQNGWTMPDGAILSQTGIDLFENPTAANAALNISLSAAVLADANMLAASSEYIDLTALNSNEGNNENALDLVALTSSNSIAVISSFDDFIKSLVIEIAVDSGYSSDMCEAQELVVLNLENRRLSISGVSLDEEMTNLVKYENSYAACSRVITAIDEALEKLINGTGLVGR